MAIVPGNAGARLRTEHARRRQMQLPLDGATAAPRASGPPHRTGASNDMRCYNRLGAFVKLTTRAVIYGAWPLSKAAPARTPKAPIAPSLHPGVTPHATQ